MSGVGGFVQIVVDGETLTVFTVEGESAADVLVALAAEIDADPELQALGTTASASGNTLATNGSITSVLVSDAGLGQTPPAVPAFGPFGLALLAGCLLALAAAVRHRSRVPGAPGL